ncbi:MAG: alpha/beta hydrolase family protein [Candidatus Helarchaeota archaeon]
MSKLNKFRKYLLISSIVLMGISFLFMRYDPYIAFYGTNITQKSISFYSRDGLLIKGVLYYPIDYNVSKTYPAIVSIHGINSNLMAHTRLNIEFSRRHFFVLGIDLRGHAGSQGTCTLSKDEPFDIMGAIDYLYKIPQINKSEIGIIGHSLGAMSGIRAAFNDSRISATVAIAPPPSVSILLSYYIKNFNLGYIQNLLGLDFNISDPHELYLRSPMFWVNSTMPKNLLIQVGCADELAQDDILILRNATNNASAEVGKLYGNFSLGTARQYNIYYRNPGVQHEEEPRVPEIIIDAILWMENSLLGHEQGTLNTTDLLKWNDFTFGGSIFIVGLLLSLIPVISYISSFIFKNRPKFPEDIKIPEDKLTKKNKILSLGSYLGAYIVSSMFVIPLLNIFKISPFVTFNISGALILLFLIRALFLILSLFIIYLLEKRLYGINIFDPTIYKQNLLKSTVVGLITSLYFMIFYFYVQNIPILNWQFIYYPWDLLVSILIFTGTFFVDEIYNRVLIESKFNLKNNEKRLTKYKKIFLISICIGLVGAVSIGSMFLIFANSFIILGSIEISLVLIGLIAGFIVFSFFGFINSWIYLKTKNIISGALFQSILFTWFTATLLVVL